MRKYLLIFIAFLSMCCLPALAKNDAMPEYTLVGDGTGAQGTYLVTVSVMTKDKNISDSQLARCAVHGVLFRGFVNKEMRQSQKPLAGNPGVEAAHPDYFAAFFAEGGPYNNYVSEVNGSRQVIKSGKLYKVSSKVTVNKEQLRHDLEQAGIIKGLNSMF